MPWSIEWATESHITWSQMWRKLWSSLGYSLPEGRGTPKLPPDHGGNQLQRSPFGKIMSPRRVDFTFGLPTRCPCLSVEELLTTFAAAALLALGLSFIKVLLVLVLISTLARHQLRTKYAGGCGHRDESARSPPQGTVNLAWGGISTNIYNVYQGSGTVEGGVRMQRKMWRHMGARTGTRASG